MNWREEDALRFDYSFTTFCPGPPPKTVADVSIFYGNLLLVYAGRPQTVHFHEPGTLLPSDSTTIKHRHYQRMDRYGDGRDWVLAALPDDGPLAYLPPSRGGAPNGEEPARSTLWVQVKAPGVPRDDWDEVESLVHSDDSAENGDHFMVETDEHQRSVLRMGNGSNGRLLPTGSGGGTHETDGGGGGGHKRCEPLCNQAPQNRGEKGAGG